MTTATTNHKIVSPSEWIEASAELLRKEKEFTKLRDQISATRRELPWTPVDQDYTFSGPDGETKLSELFGDKSQLIIYHCMYGPEDTDGCPGCSMICDHVDAARQHFEHHDIAFAAVSRGPWQVFDSFKKRMGWTFRWLSSAGTSFNYDYQASFHPEDLAAGDVMYNFKMQPIKSHDLPGLTVFVKDADGRIYRTYSTYERGLDLLIGAYNFIDLTPVGRNEQGPMDWVNFHDQY